MTVGIALLDASAFWRLGSPQLADDRRQAVADRITRGTIAASTLLWITERAERRALDLQRHLRAAHQHLGVAVEALAPLGSLP
ncbi:MAG: hypothetical protein M0T77_12235 [Actinomycetota bacterium]|nr:hypothetical protein [Actinomycetota bacterium]